MLDAGRSLQRCEGRCADTPIVDRLTERTARRVAKAKTGDDIIDGKGIGLPNAPRCNNGSLAAAMSASCYAVPGLTHTPDTATLEIRDAFAQYDATQRNVQWFVSAWAADGSLVVSMWEHHRRKSTPPGMLEFEGSANRWRGPGNAEIRANIAQAFAAGSRVRLVVARTNDVALVEAGEDASKAPKEYYLEEDVVGRVTEWDSDRYAITFTRSSSPGAAR